MPIPDRDINSTREEHLSDHETYIKPVVDAFEGADPSDYALAGHGHTATQIPFTPSGTIAATNVQTGLVEVAGDAATLVSNHVTDTTAAHAAAAISMTSTGAITETDVQAGLANLDARVSAIIAVSSPLGVPFSSFAGATDDAKLVSYDNARKSHASGLFGYPVLLDVPRVYTFNNPLNITSGFCVIGGARPVDQARSSKPIGTQVNLRRSSLGGWLVPPNGTSFGVALIGISFDANSNSRVFGDNPSANCTYYTLRDIAYQNGPGVLGSTAEGFPMTICTFEGIGNWNNVLERGFHIRGSDCAMDFSRLNLDSNPASAMGANGYLCEFSSMSKTYVKGLYVTADQHSAMLCDSTNGFLRFHMCDFEGRNETTPCFGALIRDSTSYSQYNQCWFAYAMTAPASGPNSGDLGYIHHTSGVHEYDGCHVKYANANTPASTAVIYATGASTHVRVRNMTGEGNTSVTGQTDSVPFTPRVRVVGGATHDCDTSVTVVTS